MACFTNPPQKVKLFAGGSTATKLRLLSVPMGAALLAAVHRVVAPASLAAFLQRAGPSGEGHDP